MPRYVVHNGTGTIINLDDNCTYLDTDLLEMHPDTDAQILRNAEYYGVPMTWVLDSFDKE